MSVVSPINNLQKQQVIEESQRYIGTASKIFARQFEMLPILFDLTGRAAGMYRVKGRLREIRYNPYIFAKYFNDNLSVTVPHEVAHYIIDEVIGLRRVRPHGQEWRSLMDAFGADDSRTCQYDLTGIPVRQYQRYTYRCQCTYHELTTRRHNKITNGEQRYMCKSCGSELSRHNTQKIVGVCEAF